MTRIARQVAPAQRQQQRLRHHPPHRPRARRKEQRQPPGARIRDHGRNRGSDRAVTWNQHQVECDVHHCTGDVRHEGEAQQVLGQQPAAQQRTHEDEHARPDVDLQHGCRGRKCRAEQQLDQGSAGQLQHDRKRQCHREQRIERALQAALVGRTVGPTAPERRKHGPHQRHRHHVPDLGQPGRDRVDAGLLHAPQALEEHDVDAQVDHLRDTRREQPRRPGGEPANPFRRPGRPQPRPARPS